MTLWEKYYTTTVEISDVSVYYSYKHYAATQVSDKGTLYVDTENKFKRVYHDFWENYFSEFMRVENRF